MHHHTPLRIYGNVLTKLFIINFKKKFFNSFENININYIHFITKKTKISKTKETRVWNLKYLNVLPKKFKLFKIRNKNLLSIQAHEQNFKIPYRSMNFMGCHPFNQATQNEEKYMINVINNFSWLFTYFLI